MATLSIQATYEGLYVHQMGGFNASEAARLLNIPEEYQILVAFALGYRGETEVLDPNLMRLEQSPRVRRLTGESVFTGHFGHTADFL